MRDADRGDNEERNEHTYRELFQKLELPLILVDRDRKIRDLNPAFCQFFCYGEHELLGKEANTVLPDYGGIHDPQLQPNDPRKNTLTILLLNARRKGAAEDIPVELVANLVYLGDEPYHLISIEDGSQKQIIENRQAVDQTVRNIANLSGAFAHNFNNLLSPMMMSAELLQRETDSPNLQKRARTILDYSNQVKALIDKLLQFSGNTEFNPQPLSPNRLLERLVDSLAGTLPNNIEMKRDCEKDLWTISGNCEQLLTALLHLTSNARQAMPEGGRLTLTADNIRLSHDDIYHRLDVRPGPFVEISVIDTGSGIPSHHRQKIFEPFFTTWSVTPGRGLGLSAAAGIIHQHSGFIEISSEEGKGASFQVRLPAI